MITKESGTPDVVEACSWIQLAARGGVKQAKVNLADFSRLLTDEQLRKIARRADDFGPQPVPTPNPVKRNGAPGTPMLDMAGQ